MDRNREETEKTKMKPKQTLSDSAAHAAYYKLNLALIVVQQRQECKNSEFIFNKKDI